jgi:exopolysaccharide biosynthesis polyprenyl glycosylphosphotransferase
VGNPARTEAGAAPRLNSEGHVAVVAAPATAGESGERAELLAAGRRTRRSLVRYGFVVSDMLALTLAFVVARWLIPSDGAFDSGAQLAAFALLLPLWVPLAGLYGLFRGDPVTPDNTSLDEVWPIFHAVTVGTWLVFAGSHLAGMSQPKVEQLVLAWALAVVLVPTGRTVTRVALRSRAAIAQRAVVVGAGLVGQEIARKIRRQPRFGLELVGFVDGDPLPLHHELEDVPVLGGTSDLAAIVQRNDVHHVVLAFTADHEAGLDVVRACSELGVQVDIVPRLFEVVGSRATVRSLEGTPLLGLTPPELGPAHRLVKRTMDVVGALAGLIALSPFLLITAIAIKLSSDGPIFFRQTRIGRGQRPFTIIKFRTMVADAEARKSEVAHLNAHQGLGDARMFKIPDDPRVTRVGRLLRRTSFDEFPQLLNVLRGEMSLVGPRPLIPHEHQYVNDWGLRRLDLTPGLTGLWQVSGRSEVTFSQMLVLDYLYVTNWSLWGDIKLIFRTVPAMLGKTRGAA